jgi:hypothetical protein
MEFQVEVFDSGEESASFMRGPETAANPIGVEYDPDEWVQRLKSGTPASELLVRRSHEPVSPIRGALGDD